MQHTTSTTTKSIEDRSIAKAVQIAQEEQESKARMRDAAPDLLEALTVLVRAYYEGSVAVTVQEQEAAAARGRAAIAKATEVQDG